ncbi:MAG: 2-C-methyl-D-erythritol 4-phosphate cytidylyltransferase [Bacteroidales bacterium]|nr:2-C-methyl-D-erythritol 4-phosphate cytidylyltransferase [Candidatus Scybalocola fimicaballi]
MNKFVIIVAGGSGLRMGTEIPKQFLPIAGKPILLRTIDAFRDAVDGIKVIVCLPATHFDYWHKCCKENGFNTDNITIVEGGKTRFHSVLNGLNTIQEDGDALVGVHDGVRPFATAEMINRLYDAAAKDKAVVPVVDSVDSVRILSENGENSQIDRRMVKLVQTPQVFDLQLLKKAYGVGFIETFTDDASVVEYSGHKISLVEGCRENIKITTPMDLAIAEYMLRR